VNTPWGPSQTAEEILPGVTEVTTAGHGGIALSMERFKAMPQVLRDWRSSYSPRGWYEEYCDWIVPVLAFAAEFVEAGQEARVRAAVKRAGWLRDHFGPEVRQFAQEVHRDLRLAEGLSGKITTLVSKG
jgi:Domain of unknown function (DUF7007)